MVKSESIILESYLYVVIMINLGYKSQCDFDVEVLVRTLLSRNHNYHEYYLHM